MEEGLNAPTTTLPDRPQVYGRYQKMQEKAGMQPLPLHVIPLDYPQAQYYGTVTTENIAVTQGLLDLLNDREVNAVLAHELKHRQDFWLNPAAKVAMGCALVATGSYVFRPIDPEKNKALAVTRRGFIGATMGMFVGGAYMMKGPYYEMRADEGLKDIQQDHKALASALRKINDWRIAHNYGNDSFSMMRVDRLETMASNQR